MHINNRKNYRTSVLYTKWQPGPIKKHKWCLKKIIFSVSSWNEVSVKGVFLPNPCCHCNHSSIKPHLKCQYEIMGFHRAPFSRRGTGQHRWHRYQRILWYSILFSIVPHFDFHEWVPARALEFNMFTTDHTCPNDHLSSPYFLKVTYSYGTGHVTTDMQFSI